MGDFDLRRVGSHPGRGGFLGYGKQYLLTALIDPMGESEVSWDLPGLNVVSTKDIPCSSCNHPDPGLRPAAAGPMPLQPGGLFEQCSGCTASQPAGASQEHRGLDGPLASRLISTRYGLQNGVRKCRPGPLRRRISPWPRRPDGNGE